MLLITVQVWWPCWLILLSFWSSSSIALSYLSFYSSASCLLTTFEFLFKFQSFFQMSTLLIMLVHHFIVIGELDIFPALSIFSFSNFCPVLKFQCKLCLIAFNLPYSLWPSHFSFVDLIACLFDSYLVHILGFELLQSWLIHI